MGDAVQEPRQSVVLVVRVLGLARAGALNITNAAASRRLKVMLVRRVRVVGGVGVHGDLNVRHLARGEIRCPAAARGVPVGKKWTYINITLNCPGEPNSGENLYVHSCGVLVGSTFVLFRFEDAILNALACVDVPYSSAPGAVVHRVTGSRARIG